MNRIFRVGTAAAVVLATLAAGCAVPVPVARPVAQPGQPVPSAPGYGYDRGYDRHDDRAYDRSYDRGRGYAGRDWNERAEVGRVQDIDLIRAENRTSGAGAVLGAVIGAVVGRQIGDGSGRDAGTAVGAVGGAIIGNQVEKTNRGARDLYRIVIRMNDGELRRYDVPTPGDLRVGDRVRVDGNQIQRW